MAKKGRIDKRIHKVLARNERVLVGLVPFGDPSQEMSRRIVDIYLENGVDIVELALPSEDPFVDSRQIKESNARALQAEPDLHKHFETILRIREAYPEEPFEVMAYHDTLDKVRARAFVHALRDAEIDAHLLADSIYQSADYMKELDDLLDKAHIQRIRFMPHPFREDLLDDIQEFANGFMILQSIANEEGKRPTVADGNKVLVKRMHTATSKAAVILAYGIRDGKRTREAVATGADGIIVGTAFVDKIARQDFNGLKLLIKEIKQAAKL